MQTRKRVVQTAYDYDLRAVAFPPLRPAAFFCAVVPPCDELLFELDDEPDFLPPRDDAPGEFAIFAARSFDIPLSFSASYCFSFLTFELLPGIVTPLGEVPGNIDIRLLRPGDETVVRALRTYDGEGDPEALLADPRTLMLVAFDGESPVGFVLAHDLPRRHGDPSGLFIYEVDVAETHRRRGVARTLLDRLSAIARERGIRAGFVLTEQSNGPANALYESVGGSVEGVDVVWTFTYTDD